MLHVALDTKDKLIKKKNKRPHCFCPQGSQNLLEKNINIVWVNWSVMGHRELLEHEGETLHRRKQERLTRSDGA